MLAKAILQGREVLVWGDYDVDGVTGSTLCMEVLRHHGVAAQVHLPDRQTEGYGLNTETLERLHAACTNKVGQVLLTVDCGISDVEPVARARALDMWSSYPITISRRKFCRMRMLSVIRGCMRTAPVRIWQE